MRTIDADALMADLKKWLKQIDPTHPPEDNSIPPMEDIIVSTLMTIEEQPTIVPQRMRGKWIQISPAKIYECSICGQNVMTDDIDAYKWCHGCGADMRGTE